MGVEKILQDPLRTVTEQADVYFKTDLTNSRETVEKIKTTETKFDCGYFSDSTEEMILMATKEVVVESTNVQEVGKQTKTDNIPNKLKLYKSQKQTNKQKLKTDKQTI